MILSDFDLRNYIKSGRLKIEPFSEEIIRENGLDLRLGNTIARLRKISKVFDYRSAANINDYYVIEKGEYFIIEPNERVLLHTLEYIKLPPELMGFVNLRSTYARLGLSIPPCIAEDTIVMDPLKGPTKAINAENVFSIDVESNAPLHAPTRKYVNNYLGSMIKIGTKLSEIVTTPNHKFLRFNPALTIEEAYAALLNKGDLLATIRYFPETSIGYQILEPYPSLRVKITNKLSSKIRDKIYEYNLTLSKTAKMFNKHKSYLINLLNGIYGVKWEFLEELLTMLKIPIEEYLNEVLFYSKKTGKYLPLTTLYKRIDKDIAYIVGYIVGDGGLSRIKGRKNVRLCLTDKNREMLEKIVSILRKKFGLLADDLKIECVKEKYRLCFLTILAKTFLFNFESGLRRSTIREVPEKILMSPNNIIASFIAGFFDAKGYSSSITTYFSTSSRVLAFQIQLLLLRLGILSRVIAKKTIWKWYEIIIQGKENVELFRNKVGRYCSKPVEPIIKREIFDKIPLNYTIIEVLKKLPYSDIDVRRKISNYIRRQKIPRNRIELVVKKLLEYEPPGYVDALRDLMRLSKWFWDTVRYTEKVHYGHDGGKIVDWETPTHHYAAGIYVTHNTIIDGGFEGQLTIELVGGAFPVKLYAGERFIHVVFAKLTSPVEKPYTGKYQGQRGVMLPKF